MGHLVLHVLSESNLGLVHTNNLEEELYPGEKVAECAVINKALLYSLPNRHT
jgi:hypothetical protein